MPTGHWSVWQTRAMTQPSAISAAVPKPYSSAPSNVASTTSRPLRRSPSTRRRTRSRRPLPMSVRCASARPSSQGIPACLIEFSDAAAVPPPCPEMVITSASAFATPAAIVPTPHPETSLTAMLAAGLTCLRSKTSCARSSIE